MSFYNRSGGYGGLVRFPGLNGLVRFPGLGRYGAFGDVSDAQAALNTANAKVTSLKAQISAQKKLITTTERALKGCSEDGGNIVGNILSGGISAAVCIAAQTQALGQRKGVLASLEYDLETSKAEVTNANAVLAQAKADEIAPPVDVDPAVVVDGGGSLGPLHTSTSTAKASSAGSSGGGLSPMMIAAIAIPVLGGLVYVLTRRKAAVAGYGRHRRNRRSRR